MVVEEKDETFGIDAPDTPLFRKLRDEKRDKHRKQDIPDVSVRAVKFLYKHKE